MTDELSAAVRGPIYYVSAAAWNVLGLRHWIPELHFLSLADYCDGFLPHTAYPAQIKPGDLDSFEVGNASILADADVRRYIQDRGPGGRAMMLMFDERNEAGVRDAGLTMALPSAAARRALDDKIATTRLGNEAGVRSVPNALGRVTSYAALRELADELGPDLVVQLAFGDSGMTTFFISSESDYRLHADDIEAAPEVKVMRRIQCRPCAIEGCVTRYGTVVGPLATELVGFPELTPYRGGWCGNEIAPGMFSAAILDEAAAVTRRIGGRLADRGYRGVFGLDFLLDEDTGDLYLGELNPRITGLTALTTQAARDLALPPLMVMHLLEWQDWQGAPVPDVDEMSRTYRRMEGRRAWSQLIIKETSDAPPVERAPASGIWAMNPAGEARPERPVFDTGALTGENEALVLRTVSPGNERGAGTVIARLMTEGRVMNEHFELEPRARAWISTVRARFEPRGS